MDLLSIFLFGLISAVVGGIVMLLFQFYIFTKLSDLPQETLDQKFVNDKYFLPDVSFQFGFVWMNVNCLKHFNNFRMSNGLPKVKMPIPTPLWPL